MRTRCLLVLVAVLAFSAGHILSQPARPGKDMLDAIAAVQRHSPRFLVTEPLPHANWARTGAVYLCESPRTAQELDGLSKHHYSFDPRWAGVVCFQGTADRHQYRLPWLADGNDLCLDYGHFAAFGDPGILEEVQAILAREGLHPFRGE